MQTGKNEQSDAGVEISGPIVQNKLFFFGAVNPSWETREFMAPEGFPLESLGFVERERSNLNYSAKATWQIASSHRSTRRSSAIRRRASSVRSALRR